MTHANTRALGLDFGTTNSAIALATPAGAVLATFQDGQRQTTTFRSVLYFDPEELTPTRKPRATAGPEAIRHYVQAGTRGRLIQSLKSFLASPRFGQTTIFGARYTLDQAGIPAGQLDANYFPGPHGVYAGAANLKRFDDAVRAFVLKGGPAS